LMTDLKRPDSLYSNLAEVHRVGGNVRERLSMDMTRLLGQLADVANTEETANPDFLAMLNQCLQLLSSFAGLERENITRGPGWTFISLGRRLERAIYSTRQMRELALPLDEESWPLLEYMLEVADSSMTYRSRYFTTLQPAPVLHVLMLDETNPRSLAFQMTHLGDLYEHLPRHVPRDLRTIRRATERLRAVDLQAVSYPLPGASGSRNLDGSLHLDKLLEDLEDLLPSWSNNLSINYFSHARTFATTIGA
jgi:uncharacterized alpha-E superfamily protein